MSRYYCPFCSPRYQFHKKRDDGTLICGQCGDPLTKVPLVKPIQIFSILLAFAFITPLIMLVSTVLKNQDNPSKQPLSPISSGSKYTY